MAKKEHPTRPDQYPLPPEDHESFYKHLGQAITLKVYGRPIPVQLALSFAKYNASEFAQIIFDDPPLAPVIKFHKDYGKLKSKDTLLGERGVRPIIDVTPPSQFDLEYSQLDLAGLKAGNDQLTLELQIAIEMFQTYLKQPYVYDNIDNHSQVRWHWQELVFGALYEIDEKLGHTKDKSFHLAFSELWNNNKFTTNMQSNRVLGGLITLDGLSENEDYLTKLAELNSRWQKDFIVTDDNRTKSQADKIAAIAKDAIDLIIAEFSQK